MILRKPEPHPIASAIRNLTWPTTGQDAAEETKQAVADDGDGHDVEHVSERPTLEEVRNQTPGQRRTASARAARDSTDDPDPLQDRMALVRTIGGRMREARELAGLSQQEAAMLMGYRNSSKLAKIEGSSDTSSVPIGAILKASRIYETSIDFLFGETDDWERDPQVARERAVGRWLFDWLDKARTRDTAAFAELLKKFEAVSAFIPSLAAGAEELLTAFCRLRDMNPCFEDLIGGARLEACIARVEEDGRKARAALRRLNRDLGIERAGAESESATT